MTAFYRDNADALLEEKRERCEQIPGELLTRLRAAVEPHYEWHRESSEIRNLIQASGKADPNQDCPHAHGYEALIQAIEHALANGEPCHHAAQRRVRFLEQQAEEQRRRGEAA